MVNNIVELTNNDSFEEEVINSALPVIIDFWAPWCAPCNEFTPTFESLSEEFSGKVKFTKVNVDDAPDIAANYGIMSIPTLKIFKGGEEVESMSGIQEKESLKEKLNNII